MTRRHLLALALLAPCVAGARPAGAADVFTRGSWRLIVGGELSGTIAPRDLGFFNYTDYGHNVLRQSRFSLGAELRAGQRLALLAEAQTENFEAPHLYALYVRARPVADRAFDVQAGMIPPVFGRFARGGYGAGNPLIGYPLAYQYLTTVRPDAVPPGAAGLLQVKGSGWLVGWNGRYGTYESGLPLVAARRWDTGVQARLGGHGLQASVALTQGTLGSPRFHDDNDGKQVSARVAWRPTPALALGASGARGEYLSRSVQPTLPEGARQRTFRQRAVGLDVEYGRGHWLWRSEAIWSAWDAAALQPPLLGDTLPALALSVEGRYRLWPGAHLAARVDRLQFGDILGPNGPAPWEAPVSRFEGAFAYSIMRNAGLKLAYQRNRRDGGVVHGNDLLAIQGSLWF